MGWLDDGVRSGGLVENTARLEIFCVGDFLTRQRFIITLTTMISAFLASWSTFPSIVNTLVSNMQYVE